MQRYDVTLPLSAALPVWPGDPPVRLERLTDMGRGDAFTLSCLSLSVHAGTHVDAPAHWLADGATVEALPLAALVGEALVVDVTGCHDIAAARLQEAVDNAHSARILLKTDWAAQLNAQGAAAMLDFPALGLDAARWLAGQGAALVGIESPSVERFGSGNDGAVHRALLGAGVVVVEGLDLGAVAAGSYRIACLPLKIAGSEGAPARVVLWRND